MIDLPLAPAVAAGTLVVVLLCAAVRFLRAHLWPVRLLELPLYVAAFAAGGTVFELLYDDVPALIERARIWVLLFALITAMLRLLGAWVFDVYLKSYRKLVLPALLPKVTMGAAYLLGALMLMTIIFPERDITPLLATSAITSLVLGLALQPILGNFFSGLVISLEQPFRINDWVLVGGVEGRVDSITWRTTRLVTRDNDIIVLPNSKIADLDLTNYHYPIPLHLERVYVGVHYRTPPYEVDEALRIAAERVPGVLEKPSPEVFLHEFGDSSITYEVRIWIEDVARRPRIENMVRIEIWEEFHRRGITIPFPIRTLEIEPKARRIEVAQAEPSAEAVPVRPPRAHIFFVSGPLQGRRLPLYDDSVTVGRSAECDLSIPEPLASAEHFRIAWSDGGAILTDLDSRAGTLVNQQSATTRALADLDRITVGDTIVVFEEA
jgi:small-conductance mechanosensitive channel